MSTKSSIKWKEHTADGPGYHLYDDVIDGFCSDTPPVYLRLDGVDAEMTTLPSGGVSVTVTLPRAIAIELGLVPPPKGVHGK